MNFETSKILGGIGALLILLGVIPNLNYMGIVELVGVILILVSLNGLANLYKDRNIFNNAIYGVISAVVGGVIAVAVAFTVFVRSFQDFILQLYPQWDGSLESLAGLQGLTQTLIRHQQQLFRSNRTSVNHCCSMDFLSDCCLLHKTVTKRSCSPLGHKPVLNCRLTTTHRCSAYHNRFWHNTCLDSRISTCHSILYNETPRTRPPTNDRINTSTTPNSSLKNPKQNKPFLFFSFFQPLVE